LKFDRLIFFRYFLDIFNDENNPGFVVAGSCRWRPRHTDQKPKPKQQDFEKFENIKSLQEKQQK
jgi:hypothetical protein